MKKLHLLVYSHVFPNPVEPGLGAFVLYPLRFLPDEIEIKVLAPVPFFLAARRGKAKVAVPRVETLKLGERSVEVYRPRFPLFPRNFLMDWIGVLEYLFTLRTLRKLQRSWAVDLIHAHFAQPNGIAARLLSKKTGIDYLITEHKGAIAEQFARQRLKIQLSRAYHEALRVLCVSSFLCDFLKVELPGARNLIELPNSLDPQGYVLRAKPAVARGMIFIGNLVPEKGLQYLLPAMKLLKDEGIDLQLSLVGDGAMRRELERLSRELKLDDRISFEGRIPHAEVPQRLHRADFLVLPSLIESFGIVLIEAMATGLPVLATRCGGPESIVKPNTGILVEKASPLALAEGIREILQNWDGYDAEAIREDFIQRYSMDTYISKLSEIYRSAR